MRSREVRQREREGVGEGQNERGRKGQREGVISERRGEEGRE